MHVVSNHRVSVDGDQATGGVYCPSRTTTASATTPPHNLVMTIRHYDRSRRTGEGWRFAQRKVVRFRNGLRAMADERAAF